MATYLAKLTRIDFLTMVSRYFETDIYDNHSGTMKFAKLGREVDKNSNLEEYIIPYDDVGTWVTLHIPFVGHIVYVNFNDKYTGDNEIEMSIRKSHIIQYLEMNSANFPKSVVKQIENALTKLCDPRCSIK